MTKEEMKRFLQAWEGETTKEFIVAILSKHITHSGSDGHMISIDQFRSVADDIILMLSIRELWPEPPAF